MLDVYFDIRGSKPSLQLSNKAFSSHWEDLQQFSSETGVEFSLYRDFCLNPEQCKRLAEILSDEGVSEKELGEPIVRLLVLLWKAAAMGKNLIFVGD